MSLAHHLTRRRFLAHVGLSSAALLVAACQPAPTAAPPSEPTKAQATTVPPTAASTSAPDATQAPAATAVPDKPELPIAKEPLTLSYWVNLSGNVTATMKSNNEVLCFQELEKRTGIHIDFQHPPADQATEQFNLMLASGKYPDMIQWNWAGVAGGPAKAIKDGIILRLNDPVDQYAPFLKKVLADNPAWRKQVVDDEGDIYVFPFLRGHPRLCTTMGPQMRADWLQKLDLAAPTTIDEWEAMLQAFKVKDPNGNGKADELPFSPASVGSALSAFSLHEFIGAWGMTMSFYNDKGTVRYGPVEPDFKEFVMRMASWYKDGLMDPDFLTDDQKAFDAKVTSHRIGSYTGAAGWQMGGYIRTMAQDPDFKLVAGPHLTLKKGDKAEVGWRENDYPGALSTAITTACKKVKEAVQWLDYNYSPEGHLLANFGVEGVSYAMDNDYPRYTDAVMNNPQGLSIAQALARYALAGVGGPFVQDVRYLEQYIPLPEQQNAYSIWGEATFEKLMPPVTLTAEEGKKASSIMADVDTRLKEAVTKAIIGDESADNWDQIAAQLRQMGIDDVVKMYQAALERYNKR